MKNSTDSLKYSIYYGLMYIAYSVFTTYIPVFYANKGFNLFQIGILTAIGPVLTILIQPLWAKLCDRVKYRTTVLIIILVGSMVSDIIFPYLHSFIFIFLFTVTYMVFNTSVLPISDSISTEHLKKTGGKFSIARMGGTLGYSLSVIVCGIYFKANVKNMFLVQMILYIFVITYVVFILGKEKNTVRAKKTTKSFSLLKNKEFLFILFFTMINNAALGYNGSFLSMRVRELNFSNDFVGYCFGLAALTEVPVIIVMPKLYRRFGHHRMLYTAGLATALRLIICLFASDIKLIIAAQLLQGLAYMTVYYATVTYVSENLPDDAKSFGQGLLAVAQTGFGSILGCVGGGLICNNLSITTGYGIFGFLVLFVTVTSMAFKVISVKKRKGGKIIE